MIMIKGRLQGFSAGIIFTTCIFAGCYYGTGIIKGSDLTSDEAKELLEKDGFTVSLPNKEAQQALKPSRDIDQKPKVEQTPIVSYTMKVKSNMTSAEIATMLVEEKIIDDAAEFETYMNEHDFSKKIQIGEFVVTNTMTYRQLANTLSH